MAEILRALVDGQPAPAAWGAERGLMYGDGVFRTLRMRAGRVTAWPLHYDKLARDAAALGIVCPPREVWEADLAMLATASDECVAKLVLTRGAGGRGYAPPPKAVPTRFVVATAPPSYPVEFSREGVAVRVCDLRLAHQPRLAGIKHLNRLENVLARMEWSDPALPEGLLLDMQGQVIEGTMSNLFFIRDRALVTPDLSQCGVAGVQRARVLACAPRLGLVPSIRTVTLSDLHEADEVFLTNSVIGLWPVRQIGTQPIATGTMAQNLREALDAALD